MTFIIIEIVDYDLLLGSLYVIGLSATTLINHTFENIINLCRPDTYKIVVGPTSPMSEVVFDYGIDAVSGSKVEDKETVKQFIREGANFRQLKKYVKVLTMTK